MRKISIIVPLYNEAENVVLLQEEIAALLKTTGDQYEVVYVDDGSNDGSLAVLKKMREVDNRIKIISFQRNYGQTAAMGAGVKYAAGDIIIMMDADLQNNPADIPALISKLEEGYDVVSGWRKKRYDEGVRVWLSRVANKIISITTRVALNDYGCTLKAYRASTVQGISFYGEIHRLLPAYAAWHGARVTEIVVNHRPRRFGHSKYGFSRIFKVIMDLLVVKFLIDYSAKPIYFFGMIGVLSLMFGGLSFIFALVLRLFYHTSFIDTPLLLLTVVSVMVGIQLFSMGLLADLILRGYYSANTPYSIREEIGF